MCPRGREVDGPSASAVSRGRRHDRLRRKGRAPPAITHLSRFHHLPAKSDVITDANRSAVIDSTRVDAVN